MQCQRIAFKTKKGIHLIDLADLISVEADGNYVSLRQISSSHMLRDCISKIEERLDPCGFVRIHRSVLVNPAFVESIEPRPTGDYLLRVKGGKEYTVTRAYKKNLKFFAELWIGAEGFVGE